MSPLSPIRKDIVESIRRCCEEEKKSPPIPWKYGDIPISYDSITVEWLTATLAPHEKGAAVVQFTLGPEDNGTSNRRRIELEWTGPNADKLPRSVFCKAAHEMQNRITLSNGGTYSEVAFYNNVRPHCDIEAPVAYFAAYDPQSWVSMIMLQDMAMKVAFCTHKTELSKTQFSEQVQILARLHGQFYQSKEAFFPNVIAYKDRFENLIRSLDIETVCGKGFLAAKEVIPPRLFAREREIWPATVKSVDHNASLPQTIVHGDVHLGNWYIDASEHMGLADWQAMSRGHWSRDIAYVLGTAVPPETRRLWEHEIVRVYLAELARAGGPKVDEDSAWLEIRRQSFGALWYWTFTLTPSTIMPDMQSEETALDFIGRIATFMDDHNALESII